MGMGEYTNKMKHIKEWEIFTAAIRATAKLNDEEKLILARYLLGEVIDK